MNQPLHPNQLFHTDSRHHKNSAGFWEEARYPSARLLPKKRMVYSAHRLQPQSSCFFSSQEGGIFLNRFTGKCAEATAAHDLCTAIFVCLLLQRPDSQIDCRQAVLPWPNPPHSKRWPHLRKSHSRIVKTTKGQAGSGSRHCLPVQKNQLLSASERERERSRGCCLFFFPFSRYRIA